MVSTMSAISCDSTCGCTMRDQSPFLSAAAAVTASTEASAGGVLVYRLVSVLDCSRALVK